MVNDLTVPLGHDKPFVLAQVQKGMQMLVQQVGSRSSQKERPAGIGERPVEEAQSQAQDRMHLTGARRRG